MDFKRKLIEALQWYQKGYNITNDENTINVIEENREIYARFGSIEEDGYKVTIIVYMDGDLNRIFFSDDINYIECREQEVLNDLLYMNGAFNDFIHDSCNKLERKLEQSHKTKKNSEGLISSNPLN